jgi:CPA1 family monovalent cation:H+ antiporter
MEVLAYVAAALVIIALTNAVAPKIGVAAPLLLVLIGIGASFIPALTGFELDPEWILAGLLPPLLYAAAVAMPSTDFRRELSTISALSIVLVVVSAVVLGFFFTLVIPGLNLWWGIALGAVVSPTDLHP